MPPSLCTASSTRTVQKVEGTITPCKWAIGNLCADMMSGQHGCKYKTFFWQVSDGAPHHDATLGNSPYRLYQKPLLHIGFLKRYSSHNFRELLFLNKKAPSEVEELSPDHQDERMFIIELKMLLKHKNRGMSLHA